MQYNVIQYNMTQYSTIQCNTIKILIFLEKMYFRRKFCLNPLAWLAILFALGHWVMRYVCPDEVIVTQ